MITPMPFALNRVANLEDFEEQVVADAIREIYVRQSEDSPEFPRGREHRKQWEVAMAALALEDGAVLRPDAEVLGIGAGSEATLFWLTNYVRRVWATDLYADPGSWVDAAPPRMLTNPGSAWDGPWNPRRLVVQHMDACELHYEDETFDGIFSSGSIEHFGSLERIGIAMDEAFRVLKRGGTASFSTEFLIDGDPLAFEEHTVCFTPELIERVLLGNREWLPVSDIEYRLSDATVATEIESSEYAAREARGESIYPHCALRVGPNLITSVHIALRKSARPNAGRIVTSRAAPISAAGSQQDVAAPTHGPKARARSTRVRATAAFIDGFDTLRPVAGRPHASTAKRVAKRLARPVLVPVDGRVADINRRIDSVREANTEASSYIGVELRRLHDELEGLREKALDEQYRMRLARVADLPLEELDAPLAHAINDATSYRGLYAQAGLWFNPPVAVVLSEGAASIVHVSERIVELPFAMAALTRLEAGARILDVGSAESTFPLSAASLGYKVTAVDPRPLAYSHPNLESHAALLEEWDAPSEPFAAAFLISTIEHVGLGAYGEHTYGSTEHGEGADLAALDRVRELIAPDGLLILTTPYGTRGLTELERIYDEASLNKLLAGWDVLERQIVARRDPVVWEQDETVAGGSRGVVMIIARPKHS
jgi:SAM-dependent methyltransferase